MSTIEEIKSKIDEINKLRSKLLEELRVKFPEIIQPILSKFTKCNGIRWTQYTPYFNDGDTCEFGVHDVYAFIDEDSYEHEDPDILSEWIFKYLNKEEWEEFQKAIDNGTCPYKWYKKPYDPKSNGGYILNPNFNKNDLEVMKEVRDIFNSIPEDFYKDLFGDHAEIIIYKNGKLTVNDYDHD